MSGLVFLNSLYLLITFFVFYRSRFSRLTSDLPHSLFHVNGFLILSRMELRNVVNTVKVKEKNQKRDKKRLLAGISITGIINNTAAIFRQFTGYVFSLSYEVVNVSE